jgi:glycogen operon protein
MSENDWRAGFAKSLGVFLNGDQIASPDAMGRRVTDNSFYVLFNAHDQALDFTLPDRDWGRRWQKVINTAAAVVAGASGEVHMAGASIRVEARSLMLLRRVN